MDTGWSLKDLPRVTVYRDGWREHNLMITKEIFSVFFVVNNTPQDTNYTATCLPSRKLYKLDEPDMQDTAGEARANSSVMYSYGPPHMAKQKQDDQLEHTYSSYVRIQVVTLKTCQKQ